MPALLADGRRARGEARVSIACRGAVRDARDQWRARGRPCPCLRRPPWSRLTLELHEIDKACKNKKGLYQPTGSVTLEFSGGWDAAPLAAAAELFAQEEPR